MTTVNLSTELNAHADDVWQLIGGFNALPEWHPLVDSSESLEGGQVRKLSLVGGGEILERLDSSDSGEGFYSYTIESGPLPVENYRATLRVSECEERSLVEWFSEFTPQGASEEEAKAAVGGVYQAGFDQLQEKFGS